MKTISDSLSAFKLEYDIKPTANMIEIGDNGKRLRYEFDDSPVAKNLRSVSFDQAKSAMRSDLIVAFYNSEKFFKDGPDLTLVKDSQEYSNPRDARLWIAISDVISNYFESKE